ncbi:MAG TPA: elongation factor P [Candidatus Moranbacteria bacterium]|jgi:elongation factor P|nr:elongation factor P [Candidatus Moranbacteria bacterium]HQB59744.1 elongation factor P [Candidatus Moranbacteria bacterium]
MLGINEIKSGKNILWEGAPYVVLYAEHSKTGRAGAVLRTKLKNLITGNVLDKTFNGSDKVEEADMSKTKAQYLYPEHDGFVFMDTETYDQFSLPKSVVGDANLYLLEGTEVTVLNFNDTPANIELPIKVTLTVVEAPPGIKGDTAGTGGKVVILETGLKVSTPLFINEGDKIIINTEKGEYVSRA